MTNGNDELSDDAKAGVRWRWGAKGPGCDGAGVRRDWSATGLRRERDRVRRCGTVQDGAGRHWTAQPGAAGHNRAQPGATGHRRGSRRLANPVKLGAPPALCGRVEQICTEAARVAAQRRRRELLKGRRSPTP